MSETDMRKARNVLAEKERRTIMMTPEAFSRMLEFLNKTFGSAGLSMIYVMGREKGAFEASEVLKDIKPSDDEHTKRQLLERVLQRAGELGWGAMEVTQFDMLNGAVAIAVRNGPFDVLCRLPDSGYCFFLRGYMAGVVEGIVEQEMCYSGSKCIALGDDHCEIQLIRTR